MLRWARENGAPWDEDTCASSCVLCAAAARVGDLEELKALRRAEIFPWNTLTCMRAAKGGHLEILKWARENDCPWDWRTCAYAAKYGHLEILKWARENDCPWGRVDVHEGGTGRPPRGLGFSF